MEGLTGEVELNEQQRAAAEFPGSVTVISGAGTGKARVITERVRKILHERYRVDHSAVLTFNNRAAREMRRRTGYEKNLFLGTLHCFGAMLINSIPILLRSIWLRKHSEAFFKQPIHIPKTTWQSFPAKDPSGSGGRRRLRVALLQLRYGSYILLETHRAGPGCDGK